ncbi:hypothetical protein LMG28614_02326 [Paraburkholderia ultramafica]|uniref:Uncharacterized protein n=1 Tax=Paraburkholderia ultramafica TaxID=1544867 RepID=A0A6S7B3F1_9BURK|nr:hypothetical protein LMG28614_02326 [Paraburkholderia ultramafica]
MKYLPQTLKRNPSFRGQTGSPWTAGLVRPVMHLASSHAGLSSGKINLYQAGVGWYCTAASTAGQLIFCMMDISFFA